MHVMAVSYGEPRKGYLNIILGNLWATQPIVLLIWPPLKMSTFFLKKDTRRILIVWKCVASEGFCQCHNGQNSNVQEIVMVLN